MLGQGYDQDRPAHVSRETMEAPVEIPIYAQCENCAALWQWGGWCPSCIRALDAKIAAERRIGSVTGTRRHRTARGLHDHERAAKTPRRKPDVD